jgi:hypothetical protein
MILMKKIKSILNSWFMRLTQKLRPKGQMSLNSEVGRMLHAICSLAENKTIVEIGTWNGLGSSKLIAKGVLAGKTQAQVFGLEIDEKRYKQSIKNLRKYTFFNVIYGRILELEDLNYDNLNFSEREWIKLDSKNLVKAKYVLEQLPKQIDVLLLDGGEFSSKMEFEVLQDRGIKWLILDDVNVRKNKLVLIEAVNSGKFRQIWKSDERNGTAILIPNAQD